MEKALEEERRRLQQAQDEVRTSRGIVHIYAYYKKSRDDKGFWNQMEKYVSEHSEAQFSHGDLSWMWKNIILGIIRGGASGQKTLSIDSMYVAFYMSYLWKQKDLPMTSE